MKTSLLLFCLLLLAGCASKPAEKTAGAPPAAPATAPAPAPEAAPAVPSGGSPAKTQLPQGRPGSLLGKIDRGRLAAQIQQSPKPINIRHRCSFRNETGYNGSTQVEIANNEVRSLNTAIAVPLYGGSCNFDGAGFRQTARSPSIEMKHADGCTVRIWTQGPQLTISYSQCASRCTDPNVFKYIWPVLIDQPSGKCD